MAPLKISDQFMNEFGTDDPGKVIHWDRPADSMAVSSHAPGTGESSDFLHSLVPSQNTTPTTVISQDGATARNPAGLWSAENRIIDHVIKQVSIRSNLEQSSISIKLHPEELGHLKMELVADNETIKAYIHVQTQQVQDILEKNLARLREGFEQQGLVLDEIQVSVNSESKSGPDLFNDQQALHTRVQTANSTRTQESHDTISEETMVAPHRPYSIISLRI
jgi:flagellar hook-length control protein FliK